MYDYELTELRRILDELRTMPEPGQPAAMTVEEGRLWNERFDALKDKMAVARVVASLALPAEVAQVLREVEACYWRKSGLLIGGQHGNQ